MKKIFMITIMVSCIAYGCKKVQKVSYAGVFKLEKETVSGNGMDTVLARNQVKIYTDRHYMYAGITPDSSVVFGVGSYDLDTANSIDEHNMYNYKVLDSTQIFVVNIKRTPNGFKGVIPDWARSDAGTYKLTEVYTGLPLSGASALDGLWVLEKMYHIKGSDTTLHHETRYNIFWRGHFMFINNYPTDALGTNMQNGFGFGTFGVNGKRLTENIKLSGHPELATDTLSANITLKDGDEYTSTYTDARTKESIKEVYRRIK
jgi:hypothetical protein